MAKKKKKKTTRSKRVRSSPERQKTLNFDYLKSSSFRVIHVDGAHGGLSPRGGIQLALFNERIPIPKATTHELSKNGALGSELRDERVSRTAVIREVEIEALMSVETAESLVDWLKEVISKAKKAQRKP